MKFADLEDFDYDDFDDEELEELEDYVIDAATAAATADELEAEVIELDRAGRAGRPGPPAAARTPSGTSSETCCARTSSSSGEGPRKLIVFSEHKDTLTYVADRVAAELGRPEAVVTIHGGIKRHDRKEIQDRFRVDPTVQVLVATDAAGEGVNLQVANMMVNYDLPWNPNRIEQRFGRIHRIGQNRPCHLWNLVAHETREGKVFERLFQKIEQQKRRLRRPGLRRARRLPDQPVAPGPAHQGHPRGRRPRPRRLHGRGHRRRDRHPARGGAEGTGPGRRAGRGGGHRQDPRPHGAVTGPQAPALVRRGVLHRCAEGVRRPDHRP